MSIVRRQDSKRRIGSREEAVAGRPIWLHMYSTDGNHVFVSVPANLSSLKAVKKRIAAELGLTGEPIERILSCNLAEVESPEHLRDGGQYMVICNDEQIDYDSLPPTFHYVRKGTNFHVDIDKVRVTFPSIGERKLETYLLKFNIFDENGDGLVDMVDVPPLLESVGFTATKEEIHAALARSDVDSKPRVDFYGFLTVARSLEERRGSKTNRPRSMLCAIQ